MLPLYPGTCNLSNNVEPAGPKKLNLFVCGHSAGPIVTVFRPLSELEQWLYHTHVKCAPQLIWIDNYNSFMTITFFFYAHHGKKNSANCKDLRPRWQRNWSASESTLEAWQPACLQAPGRPAAASAHNKAQGLQLFPLFGHIQTRSYAIDRPNQSIKLCESRGVNLLNLIMFLPREATAGETYFSPLMFITGRISLTKICVFVWQMVKVQTM